MGRQEFEPSQAALPNHESEMDAAQVVIPSHEGGEVARNHQTPLTPDEIRAIREGVLSPIELPKREMTSDTQRAHGKEIVDRVKDSHLFYVDGQGQLPWVGVSPDFFILKKETQAGLEATGKLLHRFLDASSQLYQSDATVQSVVRRGKNAETLAFLDTAEANPYRASMFRPDLCLTENGFRLSELELLIGGRGAGAALNDIYKGVLPQEGLTIPEGSEKGYVKMWEARGAGKDGAVVIVAYDDAANFRPEIKILAEKSRALGLKIWTNGEGEFSQEDGRLFFQPTSPELQSEGDIFVAGQPEKLPVDGIDRIFELYELDPSFEIRDKEGNVAVTYDPAVEPILETAKQEGGPIIIPPIEHAYLEEKAMLGFLHHPDYDAFWRQHLTDEELDVLRTLVPPTAVISKELNPQPLASDWESLFNLPAKERQFVIKKSGASPDSWGARSVRFGQEMSTKGFRETLQRHLEDESDGVYVLQKYAEGVGLENDVYFPDKDETEVYVVGKDKTRGRFTPYYYVTENGIEISDHFVTIRPGKKSHGAHDSTIFPVAIV